MWGNIFGVIMRKDWFAYKYSELEAYTQTLTNILQLMLIVEDILGNV
jgi:hypothetical protein